MGAERNRALVSAEKKEEKTFIVCSLTVSLDSFPHRHRRSAVDAASRPVLPPYSPVSSTGQSHTPDPTCVWDRAWIPSQPPRTVWSPARTRPADRPATTTSCWWTARPCATPKCGVFFSWGPWRHSAFAAPADPHRHRRRPFAASFSRRSASSSRTPTQCAAPSGSTRSSVHSWGSSPTSGACIQRDFERGPPKCWSWGRSPRGSARWGDGLRTFPRWGGRWWWRWPGRPWGRQRAPFRRASKRRGAGWGSVGPAGDFGVPSGRRWWWIGPWVVVVVLLFQRESCRRGRNAECRRTWPIPMQFLRSGGRGGVDGTGREEGGLSFPLVPGVEREKKRYRLLTSSGLTIKTRSKVQWLILSCRFR